MQESRTDFDGAMPLQRGVEGGGGGGGGGGRKGEVNFEMKAALQARRERKGRRGQESRDRYTASGGTFWGSIKHFIKIAENNNNKRKRWRGSWMGWHEDEEGGDLAIAVVPFHVLPI